MNKREAIAYMTARGYAPDGGTKVTFKVCDHENNPVAPEKRCYKLYYTCRGVKGRFAIWPNTVGYQCF